jgi:RNA polymerase sigma-70 factor (ECF subfamily)
VSELDDAVQEVFLECFRRNGVLERADAERPGGFRPFLFGVIKHVASRMQLRAARDRRRQPPGDVEPDLLVASDGEVARAFDRAWATAIMHQAAELQAERARNAGPEAQRRVELLQVRFFDDLPIREIASRWEVDVRQLHREYAKARDEFHAALRQAVAFHCPAATPGEVERECDALLGVLQSKKHGS